MKFQVERNWVEILGVIWMPAATCGMKKDLSSYDIENIRNSPGETLRDKVEHWLCLNAGDFQSITDFYAVVGDEIVNWQSEENELTYNDCMYPAED